MLLLRYRLALRVFLLAMWLLRVSDSISPEFRGELGRMLLYRDVTGSTDGFVADPREGKTYAD